MAQTECKKCVLDVEDDPNIRFNEQGICNYCIELEQKLDALGTLESRTEKLAQYVKDIKKAGEGKPYNCILGLSGGVDSSYMASWVHSVKLRPLVVHMDNGWNSEKAVQNIERICETFNFPLHTIVLDWEEFKQLQLAYLRASVVDIEVLTDHAISAAIYKMARKHSIRYTLSGFNVATEGIMPRGWTFDKKDFENIRDIVKQYGQHVRFKTFPHLTMMKRLRYQLFHKLESVQVLNYMDYDKHAAKKYLIREIGWQDYGGKHYESIFTRFYQAYILPEKFGIDKRKAHLATLIGSGQVTKEEALEQLKAPLYDPLDLRDDKTFVIDKFGLTEVSFEEIMNLPIRKHSDFKTEQKNWDLYFRLIGGFKKFISFGRTD